jgi:hypothetical protein
MRLLIVGPLGGQISAATKIAMEHGAKVAHVDTNRRRARCAPAAAPICSWWTRGSTSRR